MADSEFFFISLNLSYFFVFMTDSLFWTIVWLRSKRTEDCELFLEPEFGSSSTKSLDSSSEDKELLLSSTILHDLFFLELGDLLEFFLSNLASLCSSRLCADLLTLLTGIKPLLLHFFSLFSTLDDFYFASSDIGGNCEVLCSEALLSSSRILLRASCTIFGGELFLAVGEFCSTNLAVSFRAGCVCS